MFEERDSADDESSDGIEPAQPALSNLCTLIATACAAQMRRVIVSETRQTPGKAGNPSDKKSPKGWERYGDRCGLGASDAQEFERKC